MRGEWFIGVVTYTILQRLSEVIIAKRNTSKLLERGAMEYGSSHYVYMVSMHSAFFVSMIVEFMLRTDAGFYPALLAVFALAQIIRFWVMRVLRERWTTRVLVIKGEKLASRGPYRYLSHPNYLVVCLEIIVLPLTFGLWITAMIFTILNGIMLFAVRIPTERQALEWSQQP